MIKLMQLLKRVMRNQGAIIIIIKYVSRNMETKIHGHTIP